MQWLLCCTQNWEEIDSTQQSTTVLIVALCNCSNSSKDKSITAHWMNLAIYGVMLRYSALCSVFCPWQHICDWVFLCLSINSAMQGLYGFFSFLENICRLPILFQISNYHEDGFLLMIFGASKNYRTCSGYCQDFCVFACNFFSKMGWIRSWWWFLLLIMRFEKADGIFIAIGFICIASTTTPVTVFDSYTMTTKVMMMLRTTMMMMNDDTKTFVNDGDGDENTVGTLLESFFL